MQPDLRKELEVGDHESRTHGVLSPSVCPLSMDDYFAHHTADRAEVGHVSSKETAQVHMESLSSNFIS